MRNNTSINEVPGARVILRRHNGVSSGSSRIISLGCVRAANNSPLFPVRPVRALRQRRIVNDDARHRRNVPSTHPPPLICSSRSLARRRARSPRRVRDRDSRTHTRDFPRTARSHTSICVRNRATSYSPRKKRRKEAASGMRLNIAERCVRRCRRARCIRRRSVVPSFRSGSPCCLPSRNPRTCSPPRRVRPTGYFYAPRVDEKNILPYPVLLEVDKIARRPDEFSFPLSLPLSLCRSDNMRKNGA